MSFYTRPLNLTPTYNASNYTFQDGFITRRLYWNCFSPLVDTTPISALREQNEVYSGTTGSPYARIYLNGSNQATLEVPRIGGTDAPDIYTNLYFDDLQILTDPTGVRITTTGRTTPFMATTNTGIPTLSGLAIQPDLASQIHTPVLETKLNFWGFIIGGNNNGRVTHSCQISSSIHRPFSLNLVGMTDATNNFNTRAISVFGNDTCRITGGFRLNTSATGTADRLIAIVQGEYTLTTSTIVLPIEFTYYEDVLGNKTRLLVSCRSTVFPSATIIPLCYHIENSATRIRLRFARVDGTTPPTDFRARVVALIYD